MIRRAVLLAVIALPLLAGWAAAQSRPAPAASVDDGGRWLRGGADGWFFYRERPEPSEPEASALSRPAAAAPPAAPVVPTPPAPADAAPSAPQARAEAPSSPAPLTAAWFRQNLESFRDRALDNPTPENVQAFLFLQRIMLDKAQRFTDATAEAVAGNPALDANSERPLATFAAQRMDEIAAQAEAALLGHLAGRAGLLFFFRPDCAACDQQAPVLETLSRLHGFNILAVSLDGRPLSSGLFPRFARDVGQAATLGVQRTPALFLMRPPGEVVPISQGVLSLAELRSRILLQARTAGWISEEAWRKTRPVAARSLASLSADLDASVFSDPAALVAALRQHLGDAP